MRKIIVEKKNKKIVNYLKNQYPNCPESAIYKALRQKDIRINGEKIVENVSVEIGDEITIYVKDEILLGANHTLSKDRIIYNDENIVIVNKPQGILVQSSENELGLDELVNQFFQSNTIVPCHRLDRNTAGLVIFAKDKETEGIILNLMKNHEICKHYSCLVYGHPQPNSATLKAYLFKDRKNNRVIIASEKKKGYVEIVTKYKVIKNYDNHTSLLDVELITGRTHQIRAHLAFMGHPIIGDGKYGNNQINQQFGKTWQELESRRLTFQNAYGKLTYLKGKTFSMGDVFS